MLVVRKSIADEVQRRWGTPALKKSETRRQAFLREGDPAFEWYKKRIMSLIKERINAADEGRLEKAGYAIGTPRVWKDGHTYVKVAPNKWRRKYDASNEGGYHHKATLTRFYKRIAGCTDEKEIQATIRSFVLQFRDASGYPMKWVPDFLGDARKALADAKRMSNPAAGDKIEQGHREFAKKHGYSGARNFNYGDDAQIGEDGGEPPNGGEDDVATGNDDERGKRKFALSEKHAPIKKFDVQNFASNNANRMYMGGVHYENGFKVATDGRRLVVTTEGYKDEFEGKTIKTDANGSVSECEGVFPNWMRVIPRNAWKCYEMDYEALNDAAVNAISKWEKLGKPDVIPSVLINQPDGSQLRMNAEYVRDLCAGAKKFGITTFGVGKETLNATVVSNNKACLVTMPMQLDVESEMKAVQATFDMTDAKEVEQTMIDFSYVKEQKRKEQEKKEQEKNNSVKLKEQEGITENQKNINKLLQPFAHKNKIEFLGVTHKNGFAVVSDGQCTMFAKTDYAPECEGKVLFSGGGKTFDVTEYTHPLDNWKDSVPAKKDLKSYKIDFEALDNLAKKEMERSYNHAKNNDTLSSLSYLNVTIKQPNGRLVSLGADVVHKMCVAAKKMGINTISLNKNPKKPFMIGNESMGMVVTPEHNFYRVRDLDFDMKGAKEVPVETPFDDDTQKSLRSLRAIRKSIARARRIARRG